MTTRLLQNLARAPRLARPLGALLGWFVGSCLRVRRAHVVSAMQRAGIARPGRAASAMYRKLGRGLFELLWLSVRPRTRPLCLELDAELLEAARGGAVIATAHVGNWDWLACATAERLPLTVITKHFSVGVLDRLWQGARRRYGVKLVRQASALHPVRAALARRECVAMLVDQAPERARGIALCRFLGATAHVDLAPAWIALRARVPLLCVVARRLPGGRHRAELLARFEPPRSGRRAWAVSTMQSVTEHLERFVLAAPAEWLWMHRRWKVDHTAAARRGAASVRSSLEPVA